MSDRPDSAHFNYIFLLGELEKACRARKPKLRTVRAGVQRAVDSPLSIAREVAERAQALVTQILSRAAGDDHELDDVKVSADRLARLERAVLRNIRNYTSNRTSADRSVEDIWPAPIPDGRVLERLIATTLGLATEGRGPAVEDPEANFQVSLQTAIRSVLLPALAWRILCELHTRNELTREELLRALVARLEKDVGVQADFHTLRIDDREHLLSSLVLQRAWFDVLTRPPCSLPQETAVELLCRGLATLLKPKAGGDATSVRTNLFPALTQAFGWGAYGSERAHAIELAWKQRQPTQPSPGKAVFASGRLRLLDAAHSKEVRHFADLARFNLKTANDEAADALKATKALEVERYAGMAYWLAHACFRRPMAYTFADLGAAAPAGRLRKDGELADIAGAAPTDDHAEYDTASELVLRLLAHADKLDATEEQRETMRRFAAGFATNPRYWRGPQVMRSAQALVEAYAREGGRASLVHQFRGRLAWQEAHRLAKRERGEAMREVLRHYRRCFASAGKDLRGLDAEAPLHLFPELIVLTEIKGGKRDQNALGAVDFILSRNFSIYMDIDAEKTSILAGLDQYAAQPTRLAPQSPTF